MAAPPPPDLVATLQAHQQQHALQYWSELPIQERDHLVAQLSQVDFANLTNAYLFATKQTGKETTAQEIITPLPQSAIVSLVQARARKDEFELEGLRAVALGKVAGIILAGGQGTRLGFEGPKGAYNAGFPSTKSLFQMLVERTLRVAALADEEMGIRGSVVPLYIMTSPINEEATKEHFRQHAYFGMDPGDVFFFQQGVLPALDNHGKVLLETKSSLAFSPDGNGGIYDALERSGALSDMEIRGITAIHLVAVDNPLSCLAEPSFVGCCLLSKVEVGNLCVSKTQWDERVGVAALRDGCFHVVEYSEITPEMAKAEAVVVGDAQGGKTEQQQRSRLEFGMGNICNHFFTIEFLRVAVKGMKANHHVARKAIPCVNDPTPKSPNGMKLELFIFDAFPMAKTFLAYEAPRDTHFAPIKNASGADSPATARAATTQLHSSWLTAVGVHLEGKGDVEISPLVSLYGEGLQRLFHPPGSAKCLLPMYLCPASTRTLPPGRGGNNNSAVFRVRLKLDGGGGNGNGNGNGVHVYQVVSTTANVDHAKVVMDKLDTVSVANTTPIDALFILDELKELAATGGKG